MMRRTPAGPVGATRQRWHPRRAWPGGPGGRSRPGGRAGPAGGPGQARTTPAFAADSAAVIGLGGLVFAAAWLWATGQVAGWIDGGRWPRVPVTAAGTLILGLRHHLGDPRLAWPVSARATLPGPAGLYGCAAGLLAAVALVGATGARIVRRSWVFGGNPGSTTWAQGSDLRPIRVPGRAARSSAARSSAACSSAACSSAACSSAARSSAARSSRTPRRDQHLRGRVVIGQVAGPGRRRGRGRATLATEARHSLLVIGPTQSGKTSGLAVPALLGWEGPAIATSVKGDLTAATHPWRSRSGPCWVFDPTAASGFPLPSRWSPLAWCGDWSGAQRMSSWLVDATPARAGVADAAFWYAAAAKQLAPLLLAAQRGGMGMADVVRWTNASDFEEPMRLLELFADSGAALALEACAGRDERIRSSVSPTLETVLAPFEDPVVARFTAGSDVELAGLFESRGTLYLCGPSHEQQRVQGLFAALVSAAIAEAVRRASEAGGPLDPPLLLVLDEAANIAPVRDLDTLASTGAGVGIQIVTVCQDLAQLAARYGPERSRTIANNHRAKLILSGVSDLGTLDLVSGLAGEHAACEHTTTDDLTDGRRTRSTSTVFRRIAPTAELRRIPPGEGVLVYGHLPPVRVRLRPWYLDRRLRDRAGSPTGGSPTANPATAG
jgi:type IV secretion system protein VirD4